MLKVTLSSKGQIVIPAELRKRHQFNPGDRFEVEDRDGMIVLSRTQQVDWRELVGIAGQWRHGEPSANEAVLAERAWEREREDRNFDGS